MRLLPALLVALALAACTPAKAPLSGGPGGAFQLTDQDGRVVDQRLLEGRWTAVFFGFTACPDFCPATLQALRAAEAELAPKQAEALQVVFISVDPSATRRPL
jgi:protein SCO1/2